MRVGGGSARAAVQPAPPITADYADRAAPIRRGRCHLTTPLGQTLTLARCGGDAAAVNNHGSDVISIAAATVTWLFESFKAIIKSV